MLDIMANVTLLAGRRAASARHRVNSNVLLFLRNLFFVLGALLLVRTSRL